MEHVVIVGHLGCGGILASLELAKGNAPNLSSEEGKSSLVKWLEPIQSMVREKLDTEEAKSLEGDQTKFHYYLVENHVRLQMENLKNSEILKSAVERSQKVTIHGW